MKKKKFVAGALASLLVAAQIISVPLTTFADNEDVNQQLSNVGTALTTLENQANGLDPKAGKEANRTYESTDATTGITWKYILNGSKDITKLWTETADISRGVTADGTLIIPGTIDYLTVKGIGSGEDDKPLVRAGGGFTKVSIPATTSSIAAYAFKGNTSLTEVTLPSSVTAVELEAFKGITTLNKVTIKGAANVGVSAFEGTGISELTLTDGKSREIQEDAFKGLVNLTQLYIPAQTILNNGAFRNCTALSSLETASNLTKGSFDGCTAINTVVLDPTVGSIEYGWAGDNAGPSSRTVYVKNANTKAMMGMNNAGTAKLSPFGNNGDINVIFDSTGKASLFPFAVTAPTGQTPLENATGVAGDIMALSALTSPTNDAELLWVKGTATSVTFTNNAATLASAISLAPDMTGLTAERNTPLKVNKKLTKSNVTVLKNGVAVSANGFYVMRKSIYDAIDPKTQANVEEKDALSAHSSDLKGASGIIKAVAVVFEGGSPLTAEFDIRVEGESADDFIFKNGVDQAAQNVEAMSTNATKLGADIDDLEDTLAQMLQTVNDEITAKGTSEPLETAKANIESMQATLNGYKTRYETVDNKIKAAEQALEGSKIDISNAVITLSTNSVKKGSDGKVEAPRFTVAINETELVKDRDYTSENLYTKGETTGKIKITGIGTYKGTAEKTFNVELAGELIVDTGDFIGAGGSLDGRNDVRVENGTNNIKQILKQSAQAPVEGDTNLDPTAEDVYVSMSCTTPKAEDKTAIDNKIKDMTDRSNDKTYRVVSSFDVSITAEDGDGNKKNITETSEDIQLTADIPEQYQDASKYTVGILRIHNGVVQDITEQATINRTSAGKNTSVLIPNRLFSAFAVYVGSTGNTVDPNKFIATIPKSSYACTGNYITPEVTVKYDGNTLKKDVDYTLTYSNNKLPGMATIKVQGLDSSTSGSSTYPEDYSGCDVTINFGITGSMPSGDLSKVSSILSGASTFTYTGKAITPAVLVMDDGAIMTQGTDYTLFYQDNVDAGVGSVIVQGINGYVGYRAELTFTIDPKDIGSSGVSISDIDDKEIDEGDTATQKPKIKYNGMTLSKGKDYTLSYTNNKKSGTATVTIEGQGNYTGTVEEDFKVKVKSSSSSSSSSMWSNSSSMYGMGGTPNSSIPISAAGGTTATGTGSVAGAGGSPKTNDISTYPLWFGLVLLAGGIGGVVWMRKNKKL